MAESKTGVVRCDACPVLCRIREGKTGACDRYANEGGVLTRVDPLLVAKRSETLVPFLEGSEKWDGAMAADPGTFVTGIGSGTTYPDYKPAPFIVGSEVDGIDQTHTRRSINEKLIKIHCRAGLRACPRDLVAA